MEIETIMNINFDNIVTISINEGVNIERLQIRYVRPYRPPSAFSNNHENESKTSCNSSQSTREKTKSKEDVEGKSTSSANMASVASKVSPPAMSPFRPQQTYYFGQNQEPSDSVGSQRWQSAVDKLDNLIRYCEI